jgi:hypothetical protein
MEALAAQVPTLAGTAWVADSNGSVPDGALVGGIDNGEEVYIARSEHNTALIPGKFIRGHTVTYVAWGGGEHAKNEYEVLVVPSGSISWVPCSGSEIPPNSVPGGISEDGEPLYIGRVSHEGTVTVGKVHPSHGSLYIPFGGAEVAYPDYSILVKKD